MGSDGHNDRWLKIDLRTRRPKLFYNSRTADPIRTDCSVLRNGLSSALRGARDVLAKERNRDCNLRCNVPRRDREIAGRPIQRLGFPTHNLPEPASANPSGRIWQPGRSLVSLVSCPRKNMLFRGQDTRVMLRATGASNTRRHISIKSDTLWKPKPCSFRRLST